MLLSREHIITSGQVGANVIAMYPSTSIFIAVGQLAIAILVMFSYPLQVHPCRNCLDKIFCPGNKVTKSALTDDDDDDDDDDLPVVDETGAGGMSAFKHTLLTVAITVSGFTIAYFVDDLQTGEPIHAAANSVRVRNNPTTRQFSPSLVPQGRRRFHSFCLACSSGN